MEKWEKADYPQQLEGGLLVASDGSDAPQVVSELPQAVHPGYLPKRTGSARRSGSLCPMGVEGLEVAPPKQDSAKTAESAQTQQSKHPRIFGMKRRTFFLIMIVVLVIIGAVVGGAVGGTRQSRKNATSTTDVPPSSTTPNAQASPTTTPSFKMQVYEKPQYKGRSQLFYTAGGFKTAFLGYSYQWEPGQYSETVRCSVATCFNDYGSNGWWGVSQREWPGSTKNTSLALVYIHIKCTDLYVDPGCPVPADASTYTTIPVLETTSMDPSRTVGGSTLTESSTETPTPSSIKSSIETSQRSSTIVSVTST